MNLPFGSEVVPLMTLLSFRRDKAIVAYSMGCRSTESRIIPSIFPGGKLTDGWALRRDEESIRKLRRTIFFKMAGVSAFRFVGIESAQR
jgi:hypothetical protein